MILVLNKNSYSSNNNHHHHHPGSFTRILDGYNAFQCLGGTGSRLELWLRPFQTHDSQTKYQHRMLNTSLFGILLTHHGKTHKNKKQNQHAMFVCQRLEASIDWQKIKWHSWLCRNVAFPAFAWSFPSSYIQ